MNNLKTIALKLSNRSILFIIIITAAVLRLYNYFNIPYTYDEFSALFRLDFHQFSELISKGVKIDGHPAGIQVFLYFFSDLFGTSEWAIKLPFVIFGISSVYLIYVIAKNWFNETVGLLSSAFLASIQYTIMYSQIARPYISGLFFSLLMVHFWTHLIRNPERNFYRNALLYVLASSLCSYNHHFSLLFAAIVGVSGVFLIRKDYLTHYILCGVLIFALYIPHLNIFFYQLSMGGVEQWLAKPDGNFIIDYVLYVFNYSGLALILILVIPVVSIFQGRKNKLNKRYVLISLIWFLLPLLIGFFYSKYFSAVLQFSVLIFSFPFFILTIFSQVKSYSPRINLLLVALILVINITTLIFQRDHYDLFYNSVYEHILTDYNSYQEQDVNALYIVDSHQKITEYYVSKLGIDSNYINYSTSIGNIKNLKSLLDQKSTDVDKLYLGCLYSISPNVIPLIREFFPLIEHQNDYCGGSTYIFRKSHSLKEKNIDFLAPNMEPNEHWSSVQNSMFYMDDKTDQWAYRLEEGVEWGPTFSAPVDSIIQHHNDFIDISSDFQSDDELNQVYLVALIESNGEPIHWSATAVDEFVLSDSVSSEWTKGHHSVKLSDVNLNQGESVLKVFVWNNSKNKINLRNFQIKLRKGNPVIYGLYERL